MKPQAIKSKLVRRGILQAQIARNLQVSRAAVNMTITGLMRSDRIEAAISDAIDLPRDRVFPRGNRK